MMMMILVVSWCPGVNQLHTKTTTIIIIIIIIITRVYKNKVFTNQLHMN